MRVRSGIGAPDLSVRKAHLSSFDAHSGGGLLPHSALVVGQTFEISCVGRYDKDGYDVDVWQDLFRVMAGCGE